MIDKQIVHVAVQTVLHVNFKGNRDIQFSEKEIQILSDKIHKKIIDFQRITQSSLPKETELRLQDVLGELEVIAFRKFSEIRKMTPEELLRKCILFYCPLDIVIEKILRREDQA